MGVELYDRKANLIIAPEQANGLKIEDLRITFRIEKTSSSEPNKANIKVYNLAKGTRDWIKAKDQLVVLNAGYVDLIQQISVGVIDRVEHKRESVDIITELECKDGGLDLRQAEFQRSYSAGTSKRGIIKNIIAAMPNTDEGSLDATGITGNIEAKLSLSGSTRRILDKLARAWDYEWSVQDGAIQILNPTGTLTSHDMAIVLRSNTGLIGTPVKTDRGMKCKSLLIPSIKPGTYLKVESEFLTGHFKAESVSHVGDNTGGEWSTEAEAIKLI